MLCCRLKVGKEKSSVEVPELHNGESGIAENTGGDSGVFLP